MNNRLRMSDAVVLIVLLLFTALFAVKFVDFSIAPFEDAAILMRYAEHFAQGHGIVWNIGEKPVDGATDFLFMILLGLFAKAGMSLEFATRLIGFSSHVITVWIVYLASRRLFSAKLLPALVTSVYLAVGPGLYYVAAYFGTPFFALFGCITWYVALTIIVNGETRSRSLFFAVSALVTALIRPEGLILSALMLLGIVYIRGVRRSAYTILCYVGILFVCGGAYFL
jgi:arabinofuranosyltransferase